MGIRTYWTSGHQFSYNFLVGGLLLLLYELSLMLVPTHVPVINAIDRLFQEMMYALPYGHYFINGGVLLFGVVMMLIDYRKGLKLNPFYLVLQLMEAFVWATLIYFNLSWMVIQLPFVQDLMQLGAIPNQMVRSEPGFLQNLSLSLGAGFYEELFFRLILVKLLQYGFVAMMRDPTFWPNRLIIVVVTALLFSAAHLDIFLGSFGEPFNFYAFVFRFTFGLLMSLLLVFRGFGITAWTHAYYDVLVYTFRFLA